MWHVSARLIVVIVIVVLLPSAMDLSIMTMDSAGTMAAEVIAQAPLDSDTCMSLSSVIPRSWYAQSRSYFISVIGYWRTHLSFPAATESDIQSMADQMQGAILVISCCIAVFVVLRVLQALDVLVVAPIRKRRYQQRLNESAGTIQARFRESLQRRYYHQRHAVTISVRGRTGGILVSSMPKGQGLSALAAILSEDAEEHTNTIAIYQSDINEDATNNDMSNTSSRSSNNTPALPTAQQIHTNQAGNNKKNPTFACQVQALIEVQVKAAIEVRMRVLAAVVIQSWSRMIACRREYRRIFSSLNTAPIANFLPETARGVEPTDTQDAISCISSLSSWSSIWNNRQLGLKLLSTDSIQYIIAGSAGGQEESSTMVSNGYNSSQSCNPQAFRASQEDQQALKDSITAYTSIVRLQTWWRASLAKREAKSQASIDDDEDDNETDEPPTHTHHRYSISLQENHHNVIATMELITRKNKIRGNFTKPSGAATATTALPGENTTDTKSSTVPSYERQASSNSLQLKPNRKSEDTIRTSNMSNMSNNEQQHYVLDDYFLVPVVHGHIPRRNPDSIDTEYRCYSQLWSTALEQIMASPVTSPACNIEMAPSTIMMTDCYPNCGLASQHADRADSPFSSSSNCSDDSDTYEVILTSATGEDPGCRILSGFDCSRPTDKNNNKSNGCKSYGCSVPCLGGMESEKSKARKQALAADANKLYSCQRPKQNDVGSDDPTIYYVPTTEVEPLSDDEEIDTNPYPSSAFSFPSTYTLSSLPTNICMTPAHTISSPTSEIYVSETSCIINRKPQPARNRPAPQEAAQRMNLADYCTVPPNISTRTSSSSSLSTRSKLSFFSIYDHDVRDDDADSFQKMGGQQEPDVHVPRKVSSRRRRRHDHRKNGVPERNGHTAMRSPPCPM
jgi:IQ calmodulin-binding motif